MKNELMLIVLAIFLIAHAEFTATQITGEAIIIDSEYITLYPGDEGTIKINVKNTEDFDIKDVSFRLELEKIPITAIGSSEKNEDRIDEDDSETFNFDIKASTDSIPGDYNVPYTIIYNCDDCNSSIKKVGSFGLRISAKTDLEFSTETENNLLNEKGKVSLKIINQGLGKIKFVYVEFLSDDFELLSSKNFYVGTIDSDDFDLATFDVIFNQKNPILITKITYKDFENNEKVETINLPVKVYTPEEALRLGIIQKNYGIYYVFGLVILILLWIIYKKVQQTIKKKKRNSSH